MSADISEPTTPDEQVDDGGEVEHLPWYRSGLNLAVVALAIAILAGGTGWVIGNNRSIPDPNAVDVGFMQDMRRHHEQAVEMSFAYLDTPDSKNALRDLAHEIIFGQSIEIGRMIQELRSFGKPEANPSDIAMAWMGHPSPLDRMPGMATSEELTALHNASGTQADTMFVTLMTAHHKAGIEMARYEVQHGAIGEVRQMAQSMINGQQGEIGELADLLAGRTG